MEKKDISELVNEESLVIKELEGRLYFETIPLLSPDAVVWKTGLHQNGAVLGVRG